MLLKRLNAILHRAFLSQHLSAIFASVCFNYLLPAFSLLSVKLKVALSSEASHDTAASGAQWLPWSYGMDRWPFRHSRYSSKNIQLDREEKRIRRHFNHIFDLWWRGKRMFALPICLSVTHVNHMTLTACSCWWPAEADCVEREWTSTASKEGAAHQQCC